MKKKIFNQKIKVKVEIKRKKDKIFNEDIDNWFRTNWKSNKRRGRRRKKIKQTKIKNKNTKEEEKVNGITIKKGKNLKILKQL